MAFPSDLVYGVLPDMGMEVVRFGQLYCIVLKKWQGTQSGIVMCVHTWVSDGCSKESGRERSLRLHCVCTRGCLMGVHRHVLRKSRWKMGCS